MTAKWAKENRDKVNAWKREYRKNNLEHVRALEKVSYQRNKKRKNAQSLKWNQDHAELVRERRNTKNKEIRKTVLEHYGNKCQCCGETEPMFLAIDHINGGGNQQRKKIGKSSSNFYTWIIKNDFPTDLQLLCHNCNSAKGYYGYCPHTLRKD